MPKILHNGGARFPEAVPIFLGKIVWGVPGCKIFCDNVGTGPGMLECS